MSRTTDHSQCMTGDSIYVALTHHPLDIQEILNSVKSPKAGAVVLFAGEQQSLPLNIYLSLRLTYQGTTRDNFEGKTVAHLEYSSYAPRALQTMLSIAKDVKAKHCLVAISMIHRLGVVPIGEESILIAVSAHHRQAAWKAGEEALDLCKEKVEVWKLEDFGGEEGGIWRANRDGARGVEVEKTTNPHVD